VARPWWDSRVRECTRLVVVTRLTVVMPSRIATRFSPIALKFSEQACSLPEATLDALSILTFLRFSSQEVLCQILRRRGPASATSSRMISGSVFLRLGKPRRTSASAFLITVVLCTASAAQWKSKAKWRSPDQLNDSARAKTTGSY